MRKIIILTVCLIASQLHGQTSNVSIDTISNYNSWGWKAVVMQNDLITMATVPAIGGRVMQYDLGGHASIFINSAERGKTYTPSQSGQWHNFGGYKTWPSPQSRWPNSWPPPPTLDCGNYSFLIDTPSSDSVSLLVTSPIEQWIALGIRFERKATIYPGTSRVKMEQTIINTGITSVSWGMWSITQSIVNHPGKTDYENFWVYFPINPHSVYGSNGVRLPDGSSNAWKGKVTSDVYGVQFVADNKKIYADPQKGWIAYADILDSIIYAKTFEIFDGAPYPDSARVTVYVSGSSPPVYLEVEVKAPVVELAANGGKYSFLENWCAAKMRAPVLDVNTFGAIAKRISYSPATQSLSAVYGVFYKGTAHATFVDSRGQFLSQGQAFPISPLTEFQLQESVAIPDSAKAVEVRIYNTKDQFIGIIDAINISELLTEIKNKGSDPPSKFILEQNYPNPFNPSTTIAYELPIKSSVKVIIYDLQGREIKLFLFTAQSAGHHKIVWDGMDHQGNPLSSGIYVYRILATSQEDGKIFDKSAKMILLK